MTSLGRDKIRTLEQPWPTRAQSHIQVPGRMKKKNMSISIMTRQGLPKLMKETLMTCNAIEMTYLHIADDIFHRDQ